MKTAPVLVLIVLIGVLGWALPAGAEKAVMTDAELDTISAAAAAPAFNVTIFLPGEAHNEFRLMSSPSTIALRVLIEPRLNLSIRVMPGSKKFVITGIP